MIIMIISHCKTSPSLVIIKVSGRGEGDTSPDGAEKCWAAMVEVGFAFLWFLSLIANISLEVDRRKFEEMAELDKKRYVEEAVNRMEGWQS